MWGRLTYGSLLDGRWLQRPNPNWQDRGRIEEVLVGCLIEGVLTDYVVEKKRGGRA